VFGIEALATTSAGLPFALGRRDGEGAVTRDEALANAAAIVQATSLPVSGDLENGFGDAPESGSRDHPSGGRCRSGRRRDRGRPGRSGLRDLRRLARSGAHRGRGCPRRAPPGGP
jgi:hypothetical protein